MSSCTATHSIARFYPTAYFLREMMKQKNFLCDLWNSTSSRTCNCGFLLICSEGAESHEESHHILRSINLTYARKNHWSIPSTSNIAESPGNATQHPSSLPRMVGQGPGTGLPGREVVAFGPSYRFRWGDFRRGGSVGVRFSRQYSPSPLRDEGIKLFHSLCSSKAFFCSAQGAVFLACPRRATRKSHLQPHFHRLRMRRNTCGDFFV